MLGAEGLRMLDWTIASLCFIRDLLATIYAIFENFPLEKQSKQAEFATISGERHYFFSYCFSTLRALTPFLAIRLCDTLPRLNGS